MNSQPVRKYRNRRKRRKVSPAISNDLKRAVEANQGSLRFDSEAKHILSFKSVLAGIVKECIPAFENIPISEVMQRIEAVHFRESSVDGPGKKPTGDERIYGKNAESIEANPDEGKILFYVLFEILDPSGKKLLVNIELQNGFLSREWLDKREVYYLARLISGQKERFFTGTEYEKIQEVWSIWICLVQGKPFFHLE